MRKHLKLVIAVVTCCLTCFFDVLIARAEREPAVPAEEMKERWYETHYYPLYHGCEEWENEFSNYKYKVAELQDILNPPTDLLLSMSTEELASLMQDYPELNRMMIFFGEDGRQNYVSLFSFLESDCDIFYELLRREDGITCLLQEYRTSGCNTETIVDGKYKPENYQEWYAEVFGCQFIRYYAPQFTDDEYALACEIIDEKMEMYSLLEDLYVYSYFDLPEIEPPEEEEVSGIRTNYLDPEDIQEKEDKLAAALFMLQEESKNTENQEENIKSVTAKTAEKVSSTGLIMIVGSIIGVVCVAGGAVFVCGRKKQRCRWLMGGAMRKKNIITRMACTLFCMSMCLADSGADKHVDTLKSQETIAVSPDVESLSVDTVDDQDITGKVVTTEEEIVLASMVEYHDVFVKVNAAAFSRSNPDVKVIYMTGSEARDMYNNQILEQVIAGEGPDLLFVGVTDMKMLQEKGALMDLRELVPEETLEQIYPSILAEGIINDTLVGMYFDTYAYCLFANNEVWPESSITTSDIIEVAKNNDKLLALIGDHTSLSKLGFLNTVAFHNPWYSPFLDLETKESRFDSPEFAELLTVAKERGDNKMGYLKDIDVVLGKLREGKLLAVNITVKNLSDYTGLMTEYGETCHLMSYPDTGEETTGFWAGGEFLVVNTNSKHKEAVSELLAYFLSEEAQQKVTLGSIRRDVRAANAMSEEKGSAYVEEYLQFLDHCVHNPDYDWNLKEIILFGADGYFEGEYNAEEAAHIIDEQVQMYLDEQR